MKHKFKSALLSILILVIIGILLFFNYYYYKLSPKMLYNAKDMEVLNLFESKHKLNNLKLESRYGFDKVYYSAVDKDKVFIFLKDWALVLSLKQSDLDYDAALSKGRDLLGADIKVNLAIYNQKPVYVIVSDNEDIMLDIDNFEIVFKYRKGIVNEWYSKWNILW